MPDDRGPGARRLDSVVGAVHALGRGLDGVSLAELLWLAAQSDAGQPEDGTPARTPAGGGGERVAVDPRETERAGRDPSLQPVYEPTAAPGGRGLTGRKVSLPRAAALPRARELATALRPLRRPWRKGRREQLDIAGTVADFARSGELLPVFGPTPERWFDLTVVLDRSPTMAVWADTTGELLRLLASTGVFRTLRVQEINTWEPEPEPEPEPPSATATSPLPQAQSRRLVLVVSDCVATATGDSRLWDRIHRWARAVPTVLVNPLPPAIWRHSGLDLPAVRTAPPPRPGAANARLPYAEPPLLEELLYAAEGIREPWVPVPVVSLTPRSVDRWARTLMRGAPEGCAAVLVPQPGLMERPGVLGDAELDGEKLVESFLHRASTTAVRLAALCSSYAELSVALLHLVRQELVPEATPADLAEVVVGGLVSVDQGEEERSGPVLRFHAGVRERLAHRLGARDARRVRDAITRFVEANPNARSRFPAVTPSPSGDTTIAATEGRPPIADMPAEAVETGETAEGSETADSVDTAETLAAWKRARVALRGTPTGPRPLDEPPPAPPQQRREARAAGLSHRRADTPPPYFFLSYAHTRTTGPAGRDPDRWIERLFRDLTGHVMALTDLPAGVPAGFMDRELRPGEGWSERLGEVLATCRVFVPLYSPRYFASETCGREWYAFDQRTIYEQAKRDRTVHAVVPALWVPVPPDSLPTVARRLGMPGREFGDVYASEGLYSLLRLDAYAEEYERAVYQLAKRIVSVAQETELPPGSPVDYLTSPSAFGGFGAPSERVRVVVAAPSGRELPPGRTPDPYGADALSWNPYHPESRRPVGQVAASLVRSLNLDATVGSWEESESWLAGDEPPPDPVVLLLDPWLLGDPAWRRRLADLDAGACPWVRVVVPSHARDDQCVAARRELRELFARVMPYTAGAAAGTPEPDTLESLGPHLAHTVAEARASHAGETPTPAAGRRDPV
ncbi:TIR-like protein FxsC [Streptomyces sp. HUAS MG47]|uniref:TIR-like protein FxsC n=1 Tax=Streptomyces solicamelliae TaxID=3231716 RepID=UPI003878438A